MELAVTLTPGLGHPSLSQIAFLFQLLKNESKVIMLFTETLLSSNHNSLFGFSELTLYESDTGLKIHVRK